MLPFPHLLIFGKHYKKEFFFFIFNFFFKSKKPKTKIILNEGLYETNDTSIIDIGVKKNKKIKLFIF